MSERAVHSSNFYNFLRNSRDLVAEIKVDDGSADLWQEVELSIPYANWSVAGDGKLTLNQELEWDIVDPATVGSQNLTVIAVRFSFIEQGTYFLVFSEDVTENNVFETEGKFRITSFKVPISVVPVT